MWWKKLLLNYGNMTKLEIKHPSPYPIEIGNGLQIPTSKRPVAVLYDLKVEAYAQELAGKLGTQNLIGITGGEGCKTVKVFGEILSRMSEMSLPRDTVLYVVGGGTVTDLGGYIAASYLRGIDFISIPTTTLSIVDASVGGKTGINLSEGKNLVGAFYFPMGVYAELENLKTLPNEFFREGIVEAFKHGMIDGEPFLLEVDDLSLESPSLEGYLSRGIQTKIRVVETDPMEKGERRKLNLGHTLGHAIESYTKHAVSHGAAISYGIVFACIVAKHLGGSDLVPTALKLFNWVNPPLLPKISWDDLAPYIARDKKKIGTDLNWVIPMDLGDLRIQTVNESVLHDSFNEFLAIVSR